MTRGVGKEPVISFMHRCIDGDFGRGNFMPQPTGNPADYYRAKSKIRPSAARVATMPRFCSNDRTSPSKSPDL